MDTSRPVQYENAREEVGWDTERLEVIDTNTDIYCPMYPSPAKLELYAATYEHAHDARPMIMCVDASNQSGPPSPREHFRPSPTLVRYALTQAWL